MRASVILSGLVLLTIAIGSCAISPESAASYDICTIMDCPEGVSLAQMRAQTQNEAYDAGAPRPVTASCTDSGPGHITCWVDYFEFRTVCNWARCTPDGSRCDEFEECHSFIRNPPNQPPPAPPAPDPSIST